MKKDSITFEMLCESVSALASEPTTGDLKVLQRNIEACDTAECDYLTRLFGFELGRFLIEDARPKLDSPKHGLGLADCQELLALYDKLNALEGFSTMPGLEELYDGESVISCDVTAEKEIKDSLSACSTMEDAEHILNQIVCALETHPDERALLRYYTATRIHKEIMGAGIDYIEGSLSDDEKLRHNLFKLVRETPFHEYPLFLSGLRISGKETDVSLPHHITDADSLERIAGAIDSLKFCCNNLSIDCYSNQMFHLLPTLGRRIVGELTIAMMSHDIELSEGLQRKLEILNNGVIVAMLANAQEGESKAVNILVVRNLLAEVFGMISATDTGTILQRFNNLFRKLGARPGLECEVSDYAIGNWADYVIAAVCAEFRLQGYEIWNVTLAKTMLYYAIRFALAGGNFAFWETEAYKSLMAPCGI